MLKSTNIGALVFLLLFMIGCKDEPIDENVDVMIEDEFKIFLWENLGDNDRNFHFNLETIKSESCENTLLDVSPWASGNNISLTIYDIPEPDCPSPTFVSNANIDIGSLNPQIYDMTISLKNVIQNEGVLTVENDFYELKMKDLDGIIVPEKRLYKVPQNSIWGYVASDSNAGLVADGFINDLNPMVDDQEYSDGYYGYFSVENNNLTILKNSISKNSIHTFGFSFEGDNADLINVLSMHRTQNPDVDFKIFTSKGEEF